MQECVTFKINHENNVVCTQIVTHCGTIQGWADTHMHTYSHHRQKQFQETSRTPTFGQRQRTTGLIIT